MNWKTKLRHLKAARKAELERKEIAALAEEQQLAHADELLRECGYQPDASGNYTKASEPKT
jgi:hypothetical protein